MGPLSPRVDGSRNAAVVGLVVCVLALSGPVTAVAQTGPTPSRSTLWGFVALGASLTVVAQIGRLR